MAELERIVGCIVTVASLVFQHTGPDIVAWLAVTVACYAFLSHKPLRSLAPLLLLPGVWIGLIVWSGAMWSRTMHHPADWMSFPPLWPIALAWPLYALLTLFLVWRLVDARALTVAFAILNAQPLQYAIFVGGMAVTGVWL